ncbi:hypothetical protein OIU76_025315 [Salix suchowensis]|nr:hypothetical protein OIU76_025315 [Salix suchowensis]
MLLLETKRKSGSRGPGGDCGEGGACDSEVVLEGEGWGWDDGTDSRSSALRGEVNKSARFKVAGQKRCGRKEESNFSYQHSRITFFLAIATPCPLGIKCAIWALYSIATCNFLLYSGGALTHAPQVPVVEGAAVEAVKEKGASAAGRAGGGNVEVQPKDVFENSKNCSDD